MAPARLPARPRHRRRPRRQPAGHRRHPRRPRHHRLGRHQRRGRGQLARGSSAPPQAYIDRARPTRPVRRRRSTARRAAAPSRAAGPGRRPGAAPPRPSPRTTSRMVGHFTDGDVVLEFLAREKLLDAGRARHVVPRPLPPHQGASRSCSTCRPTPRSTRCVARLRRAARARTAPTTPPTTSATPTPTRPPMRGADPAIILVPGVGMFSYGKDKQTARVAGEFYVNAINVMRGAEAVSTYAPIAEAEKFRIEYWALEEAKLQRLPEARSATPAASPSSPARPAASARPSPRSSPPRAPASSSPTSTPAKAARGGRRARHRPTSPSAWPPTSPTPRQVQAAVDAALLAFGGVDLVVNNAGLSISKPLLETTEHDWDLQHDVMAKGSFLVVAGRGDGDDRPGPRRRHRLHRRRRTPSSPARTTSPTARPRPTRPTRSGCSPPSSASTASGSTASTPTASSGAPASSPAAGAPSAPRSTASPRTELGAFYAQRTLLKREVLPEHVANAVAAITSDELTHTTGLLVPVDAGVAAAFLR